MFILCRSSNHKCHQINQIQWKDQLIENTNFFFRALVQYELETEDFGEFLLDQVELSLEIEGEAEEQFKPILNETVTNLFLDCFCYYGKARVAMRQGGEVYCLHGDDLGTTP